MRVSEAKTKKCPFAFEQITVFIDNETGDTINHIYGKECICGDCMAWEYTKTKSDTLFDIYVHDNGDGTKMERKRMAELSEDEKEGYCKRIDHA